MEELEKEQCSCGCCPECNCGDNCACTPDDKCCDECTCDNNCNCGSDCKCDEHNKCNEDCVCGEDLTDCGCNDNCTCGDSCECSEDDKCCEECDCDTKEDVDDNEENEKCKCGCGESVEEESTADAYFKQLLSLRAEFDNYRKRTQNDISKAYSNGFNQAITEFLPALDSFKMATEYITDPNTLMGIQYIEKGILSTLEKMGIKVIDVSGKFDPNFHQAIGSEASSEHESGDIVKECFKGFVMGDKVIRYSQVIVAK